MIALRHHGGTVCERCEVADTMWSRLRGLMGRGRMKRGEGLMLLPAFAIHTCFMRFPIDAVFLDADLRVLDVRTELAPWRAAAVRGARAVVELPAGESRRHGLAAGDRLTVEGNDQQSDSEPGDAGSPGLRELSGGRRRAAIGTAAALAVASLVHFGVGPRGAISAVLVAVLAIVAFIDLEFRLIPNRIVIPATGAILLAQLIFFPDRALEWFAAGAGGGFVILIPALVRPGSIGIGDAKLAALIGVGLGGEVLAALLFGSLAAGGVAIWMLVRSGFDARKETIPLGPLLAAGGILALFLADSL